MGGVTHTSIVYDRSEKCTTFVTMIICNCLYYQLDYLEQVLLLCTVKTGWVAVMAQIIKDSSMSLTQLR